MHQLGPFVGRGLARPPVSVPSDILFLRTIEFLMRMRFYDKFRLYQALIWIRPGYEARGVVNFLPWYKHQVFGYLIRLFCGLECVHIDVALNSMILLVSTCTCFINHTPHLIFMSQHSICLTPIDSIYLYSFHRRRFLLCQQIQGEGYKGQLRPSF